MPTIRALEESCTHGGFQEPETNANFSTHKLFNIDGVTEVPVSIDPFYFKVME